MVVGWADFIASAPGCRTSLRHVLSATARAVGQAPWHLYVVSSSITSTVCYARRSSIVARRRQIDPARDRLNARELNLVHSAFV